VFLCFLYSVSFPYPAGILTLGDQVYLVNVRKSITDHRVHAYHKYYVVYGRKPEPSLEPSISDLTITSHVAPTQAAVESASDAHPDAIIVPPRSPSPKLETSSDLSSASQNHDRASQGLVESSSKATSDATEVSPDSLPLTQSLPQEANRYSYML
jgi:metalloendopeptidase OMA1, mitochondrial